MSAVTCAFGDIHDLRDRFKQIDYLITRPPAPATT
jgi:hypothetical protein